MFPHAVWYPVAVRSIVCSEMPRSIVLCQFIATAWWERLLLWLLLLLLQNATAEWANKFHISWKILWRGVSNELMYIVQDSKTEWESKDATDNGSLWDTASQWPGFLEGQFIDQAQHRVGKKEGGNWGWRIRIFCHGARNQKNIYLIYTYATVRNSTSLAARQGSTSITRLYPAIRQISFALSLFSSFLFALTFTNAVNSTEAVLLVPATRCVRVCRSGHSIPDK